MRATSSLTASVTRLRADDLRRAGVRAWLRPAGLRRVLAVLGLAVGGWLVSALLAGATAAATTDQPSDSDRLRDTPVCAGDREPGPAPDTGIPQARSDLDACEPTSDEATVPGPAEDGDAIDAPRPDDAVVLPEADPEAPEDTEGPAVPVAPDGPADSTAPHDPDDHGSDSDSPRDVVQPDLGESGRGAVEQPEPTTPDENPRPHTPVRPLLKATTDTLLSTTAGLTSTLTRTTEGLTGWLFGALPEVTEPITDTIDDTIDDVVDVPRTLPGTDAPLDLLPDLSPPRLPVDLDDLVPGADPDRSAGEPRVEPVAPPVKSERPAPVPRQSSRSQPAPTGSNHHADHHVDADSDTSEARGGDSSRPFGPVAPSPTAPASVATPSHPTASPHDNNLHAHRGEHGVFGDVPTVTQLRLLGTSRDHDIVGLGREAALPTTSPD